MASAASANANNHFCPRGERKKVVEEPDRDFELINDSDDSSQRFRRKDIVLGPLQPRIHRFALQCQHSKYAFVHTAQWLAFDETPQSFESQSEFAQGERPFATEST